MGYPSSLSRGARAHALPARSQAIKVRAMQSAMGYTYEKVEPSKARPQTALKLKSKPKPKLKPKQKPLEIGRRKASRLRLSIPAKLVSRSGVCEVILVDVSRTGAQIGLERPLAMEETAYLQVGEFELFCEVVRCDMGKGGGVNGLLFEEPIEDDDVISIRDYADVYADKEKQAQLACIKDWVDGAINRA